MLIIRLLLLVCLSLPPAAVYAAGRQAVPSEAVFLMAQELLEGMLERGEGVDYQIERLTRLPQELFLPEGAIQMIPSLTGSLRYGSPVQVKITINVNDTPQMNLFTAWRVRKFAQVFVTARDIPSRTVLSASDVALEQREITKPDNVLFSLDDLVGLETKRALVAGSIVSRAMLGKPQAVRTGDNITIISRVGVVVVQATGQALQGGGIGDVIRVRNLGTGKSFLARVESGNTVVAIDIDK